MNTKRLRPNRGGALLVALALFQFLPPAQAAFHLWEITEVFSNADGSVQFVELRALSSGQQFLAGHILRSTNAAGTSSFTFPSSLPGDSGNRTCLIGTTNVARVPGGVTPDYIIPPNFIRRPTGVGSAAVIFNPAPSVALTVNLPSDGQSALVRSGANMVVVPTNSPRNFAAQSNSIVPVKFTSAGGEVENLVIRFPTARGVNGAAGPNYAIEGSGLLSTPAWSVVTNVSGDGTTQSVALPINLATNQIFRLRVP